MDTIQNSSEFEDVIPLLNHSRFDGSVSISIPQDGLSPNTSFKLWLGSVTLISILMSGILFKRLFSVRKSNSQSRDPPQVPYLIPVIGNLVSYLRDSPKLASSIIEHFGPSMIVRLNFLTRDVYLVSGAEYLNSVWKNTKGMTSTNGINIALRNMFDTPKEDMKFFYADKSGITHDPHPQSSTRPEDRVFYLMHKATVDCLAGSHITMATQKFQAALLRRLDSVPVHDEWIEKDDLFGFLRPLISFSTVEAMCGARFIERFPDFVDDFWNFNSKMPRLLQGWPRWLMPKAWQARDRCISTMKQWRQTVDMDNFDGNAMMLRRWSYFSKMDELSEHAVACSDLGILWGMNSNSMAATFWLFWHMVRDRPLLTQAIAEVQACRSDTTTDSVPFDTTKLCNQPLLQSSYAETLRMYVAVYIIRKPEYQGAQVLDYKIPKDKMVVISSAMAHMDKRNWNLGTMEEHPVETFWAQRFLTYGGNLSRTSSASSTMTTDSAIDMSTSDNAFLKPKAFGPKFSLNGYSGAWVPFGGGIHQCPGRHWVKMQMLLSFAIMTSVFDIELMDTTRKVQVDMAKYGLGALNPGEKVAFRVKRQKGALSNSYGS